MSRMPTPLPPPRRRQQPPSQRGGIGTVVGLVIASIATLVVIGGAIAVILYAYNLSSDDSKPTVPTDKRLAQRHAQNTNGERTVSVPEGMGFMGLNIPANADINIDTSGLGKKPARQFIAPPAPNWSEPIFSQPPKDYVAGTRVSVSAYRDTRKYWVRPDGDESRKVLHPKPPTKDGKNQNDLGPGTYTQYQSSDEKPMVMQEVWEEPGPGSSARVAAPTHSGKVKLGGGYICQ